MIELPASMAEVTPDWPQRALGEHPALAGSARRRNNFVFNRIAAVRLVMFDWQLVARMLPGVDFAHLFFGTSLTCTGRTRLVPSLTQRYLDALQRNDVRDYNAGAFAHVFCLGTRAMTTIAVIGGASFDAAYSHSLAQFAATLSNALASVLAHDCLALLPHAATH